MLVSCAICNELLDNSTEIYITPCGHVFHFKCLSQWLPRSKTCPECRRKTTLSCIHKVYFNVSSDRSLIDDPAVLLEEISEAKNKITSLENSLSTCESKIKTMEKENSKLQEDLIKKEAGYDAMKHQYIFYKDQMKSLISLKEKLNEVQTKIQSMEKIERLLNLSVSDVNDMVKSDTDPHNLATFVTILKSELRSSEDKRKVMKSNNNQLREELMKYRHKCKEYQTKLDGYNNDEQKFTDMQREKGELLERIVELEAMVDSLKTKSPVYKSQKENPSAETGSPYLPVASSSYGMMPLVPLANNVAVDKKKSIKNLHPHSIFKKPRLSKSQTVAALYTTSLSRLSRPSTQDHHANI